MEESPDQGKPRMPRLRQTAKQILEGMSRAGARLRRSLEKGGTRRKLKAVAICCAVLTAVSTTVTAYAIQMRSIVIVDDGQRMDVVSTKSDAGEILRANNIALGNDDLLDLDGYSADAPGEIRIYRAKKVHVNDDGKESHYFAAGDVARLYMLENIVVGERDVVNVAPEDPLTEGMRIQIRRAFDVAIEEKGDLRNLSFTEGTVRSALDAANVVLAGEDYTQPAVEEKLTPGVTIHVFRVRYAERTVRGEIAYGKVDKKDGSLSLGVVKTTVKGEAGEKESVYRDRYVNELRTESHLMRETVLRAPVDQVRLVGTKVVKLRAGLTPISELKQPKALAVSGAGVPEGYKAIMTGVATAYTADTRTSTGIKPKPGYVAVDPKRIPYGSKLWIVSNDGRYVYGYAIAADTGGFAKNGSALVDLFMDNESMCRQWGRRAVTVYILDLPRADL
jgi:uncharacterized protein YabE (DUF348 family)/3D (Asp-Asp-Asp) domain-containing protein